MSDKLILTFLQEWLALLWIQNMKELWTNGFQITKLSITQKYWYRNVNSCQYIASHAAHVRRINAERKLRLQTVTNCVINYSVATSATKTCYHTSK